MGTPKPGTWREAWLTAELTEGTQGQVLTAAPSRGSPAMAEEGAPC